MRKIFLEVLSALMTFLKHLSDRKVGSEWGGKHAAKVIGPGLKPVTVVSRTKAAIHVSSFAPTGVFVVYIQHVIFAGNNACIHHVCVPKLQNNRSFWFHFPSRERLWASDHCDAEKGWKLPEGHQEKQFGSCLSCDAKFPLSDQSPLTPPLAMFVYTETSSCLDM